MDDLDRMLAETMRNAAEQAPSDGGLLSTVHQRSRRYHRRRIATGLSTAAAVLAISIPFGTVLLTHSESGPPTPSVVPAAPTVGSPSPSPSLAPAPSRSPSAQPARTSSPSVTPTKATTGVVRLVEGYTAPTFPYTLPVSAGLKAPFASIQDGRPIAFFEATELQEHADVTVTVSTRKPVFTGSGTQASRAVRGHAGTLRTVDTQPARKLTLFWRESSTRWIQLATDDTYTPAQVVALADALSPAAIAVLPPFRLDLTPAGLVADTVTASTMSFRTTGGDRVAVVLHRRQTLARTTDTVGRYQALLTRDAAGATLSVDVPDWDATLVVTVDAGLTVTDADLLRLAAGVHILNRSDPK